MKIFYLDKEIENNELKYDIYHCINSIFLRTPKFYANDLVININDKVDNRHKIFIYKQDSSTIEDYEIDNKILKKIIRNFNLDNILKSII